MSKHRYGEEEVWFGGEKRRRIGDGECGQGVYWGVGLSQEGSSCGGGTSTSTSPVTSQGQREVEVEVEVRLNEYDYVEYGLENCRLKNLHNERLMRKKLREV